MRTRLARAALVVGLVAGGCSQHGTCPEDQARGPASAASAWVQVTAPRDVSLLQASARMVLAGDSQAALAPLYRAQIVAFHVRAGDRVKAGQAVVDVNMPEVAHAAAVYRGAGRRRAVQGARRDKLVGLRGEGLTTESSVFEVSTLAAESEQQVLIAAATLRSAGVDPSTAFERPTITLKSPIDGVVRDLTGRLGEVVEAQDPPIAVIVGEGRPRVEARFMHAPPRAMTLKFVGVDDRTWTLVPEPVAHVVEAEDGVVVMWFDVDGGPSAFPGLRGTVEAASEDPSVVQVPAAALRGHGDQLAVWRRRGDEVTAIAVEVLAASGASALVRAREATALIVGDRVAEDARAHERTHRAEAGA